MLNRKYGYNPKRYAISAIGHHQNRYVKSEIRLAFKPLTEIRYSVTIRTVTLNRKYGYHLDRFAKSEIRLPSEPLC